jgi:hypothetical protein
MDREVSEAASSAESASLAGSAAERVWLRRPVVEETPEILHGVAAIARFFGVHKRTVTAMIKAGLPVAPLGLGLATTKRLALEWFEKQVGG